MIVENEYIDQIEKIWQNNNQGYIGHECNQRSIADDEMLKVVYIDGDIVFGYAVLYFGHDFCELEGYPNKIENMPSKTIYIWEIITDINHVKKGVATSILNYIKEKFSDYIIYSCIDIKNISSLNLYKKMGFKPIYNFNLTDKEEYAMMECNKKKS